MSLENFIKNITSKDENLAINTTKSLILNQETANFSKLVEKGDFIFPFLKDKIINNFVKIIKKENLKTVFEFSKIYSYDFEDLIVKSWLKFASEDLTDEILELFENGTKDQKAYCASYFSHICDNLALENLKKYSKDDFYPLKINSIKALKSFQDETILNEAKETILKSDDDFKKVDAFEILSIFQGRENLKFIVENSKNNPFIATIISYLFDYNSFFEIKNALDENQLLKIFNVFYENMPEIINLDSLISYDFLDFIKTLEKIKNQYSTNLLFLTSKKFDEFSDDIYTFDMDKNTKNELFNIKKYLNNLVFDFSSLKDELNFKDDKQRFQIALEVIEKNNFNEFDETLADFVNNNSVENELVALICALFKKKDKINLINKDNIEKIEDKNIKELILSYFIA